MSAGALALFVSMHDVMPETLDAVERGVARLEAAGLAPIDLLIVPGRDWDDATFVRLRALLSRGHRPVGHGWCHRALAPRDGYRTLSHRLHARLISRDVAEHLSRTPSELLVLIARCRRWFVQRELPVPALYVPPAWALGGGKALLDSLPDDRGFRFIETLSGVHDRKEKRFRHVPLLGFEADTPARAHAVRLSNRVNLALARRLGYARLAIHPDDFELRLADDLETWLAAGHESVDIAELSRPGRLHGRARPFRPTHAGGDVDVRRPESDVELVVGAPIRAASLDVRLDHAAGTGERASLPSSGATAP